MATHSSIPAWRILQTDELQDELWRAPAHGVKKSQSQTQLKGLSTHARTPYNISTA